MLESWSYLAVVGPSTKECRRGRGLLPSRSPSWCCRGLSVQRPHLLKVVGVSLPPSTSSSSGGFPWLVEHRGLLWHWRSQKWLKGSLLCTDYLLITGGKLVTVQWRKQVDTASPKQSKFTPQTPCPFWWGRWGHSVALVASLSQMHNQNSVMRKYQTNLDRATFSRTTGRNSLKILLSWKTEVGALVQAAVIQGMTSNWVHGLGGNCHQEIVTIPIWIWMLFEVIILYCIKVTFSVFDNWRYKGMSHP